MRRATSVTLMVASTGGHLTQLVKLAETIEPKRERRVWVTFDSPQSRSLLDGERVEFVEFMAPRQVKIWLRHLPVAWRIVRSVRPRRVVSTGSGIAMSFLPVARVNGVSARYIESAARTQGPSLTGRLLAWFPGVETVTQYRHLARGRWSLGVSVFDEFPARAGEPEARRDDRVSIVVEMGTLDFPFTRLVAKLLDIIPDGASVTWQLGSTPAPDHLPGVSFSMVPERDLADLVRDATVVVAHAGCGSALLSLENGVWPILVPRRHHLGEHVDDHQIDIARELSSKGVATYLEVDQLTTEILSRDHRIGSGHD